MKMTIHLVDDFELTGTGSAATWQQLPWLTMTRVAGASSYATRFKLAWSATGIYCLADCEDRKLTCQDRQDFDNIFLDDVVEAFFWPSESWPLYFEYEISPLGKELPILVANNDGRFMGWRPWQYEGLRKTRTATHVRGGEAKPGAAVSGWSAEFFIPFALLKGLTEAPKMGDLWRGNVYRIDYDELPMSQWAWCPDTGGNFHRFQQFGTIEFGPRLT